MIRRFFARAGLLVLLGAGPAAAQNIEPPPHPAMPPSFDCRKARLPTEFLICNNPRLSRLDGYLGRIYSDTHNSLTGPPRKALFRDQIDWLRWRNKECRVQQNFSDNEFRALERTICLFHTTLARIIVLAGRYRESTGGDHPLVVPLSKDLTTGPLSRRP